MDLLRERSWSEAKCAKGLAKLLPKSAGKNFGLLTKHGSRNAAQRHNFISVLEPRIVRRVVRQQR